MTRTDDNHLSASALANRVGATTESIWRWTRLGLPHHRHKTRGRKARLCFKYVEAMAWLDQRLKSGRTLTEPELHAVGIADGQPDTSGTMLERLAQLERDTFIAWQEAWCEGRPSRQLHKLHRNAATAYVRANEIRSESGKARLRGEIVGEVTALVQEWRRPLVKLFKDARVAFAAGVNPRQPPLAEDALREWQEQLLALVNTDPFVTIKPNQPEEEVEV